MSPPAGRALLASVALAAALSLAWLVPPVAVIVVWPILVFVPGWLLVGGLRSRIDAAGRLGLAVVLTVAVSTHLVHWLSHLSGGYGRGVVFGVAGLLALTVPIALLRGIRGPTVRTLREAAPALAVAVLAAAVVAATLGIGIWRVTPDGVSSGGSNWSDLGVHLSIAETLNSGATSRRTCPTSRASRSSITGSPTSMPRSWPRRPASFRSPRWSSSRRFSPPPWPCSCSRWRAGSCVAGPLGERQSSPRSSWSSPVASAGSG